MEEPEQANTKGDYRLAYIAIVVLLVFYGFRLSVCHSFGYHQSYNFIIGNILIFVPTFILTLYLFFDKEELKNKKATRPFIIILVIIFAILIIFLGHYKDKYIHDELKSHGKFTVAKVIGFETVWNFGRHVSNYHYATIVYHYGKKRIIQKVRNEDDEYKMNQTVKIIFSKEEPEMFVVAGEN